jgi:hypothetical protein
MTEKLIHKNITEKILQSSSQLTRLNGKDKNGHLQKDTDFLSDSADSNGRMRTFTDKQ